MLGLALLTSAVLSAGAPIPREAWVEPQQSLRTIAGFRVQVDVHSEGQLGARLAGRVRDRIERSLRREGIPVVDAPSGPTPVLDGIGALVLDVHVLEGTDGMVLAWSLHASQIVHLRTGAFAFASTWEVGDLLYTSAGAMAERLRDSLQPALDELCQAYLASHAAPPSLSPSPTPVPEVTPGGADL